MKLIGPVRIYKGWRLLEGEERARHIISRQLRRMDDTIHSLHGGIKSPALETLDKLRLKIIEEEK